MGAYYETFDPPYFLSRVRSSLDDLTGHEIVNHQHTDRCLTKDVLARFAGLHGIDADSVRVTVKEGFAVVAGQVADQRVRQLLGAVAENVAGVRGVDNLITTGEKRAGAESEA